MGSLPAGLHRPRLQTALRIMASRWQAYSLSGKPINIADGSGVAGAVGIAQGTAASNGTTSVTLTVPTSVTSYRLVLPGTHPTGSNNFISCTSADPAVCTFAAGGGGGGTMPGVYGFSAGVNGAVCDDSTDDTSALNTLLTTVSTAGGGTIAVYGTCLISGQINIPNDGAGTNPTQKSIRITGGIASANGRWATLPPSPSVLDMRFNSTTGKILTLAAGSLEIDHIYLKDGGSDCAAFILHHQYVNRDPR